MLGANSYIAVTLVVCGFALLVTASIGCTAASSKNECLAWLVNNYNDLEFLVWVYGNVYYAYLYLYCYCSPFDQE